MADREEDRAVGYGRPPVHSRFAKGRSGNPKGRPHGRSIDALLQAALDETVMIEANGRRRRVSKREAIIGQIVDGSVAADPRALKLLFDLVQKLEPRRSRYMRLGGYADDEEDVTAESAREYLIRELDRLAEEQTLKAAEALGRLATPKTKLRPSNE